MNKQFTNAVKATNSPDGFDASFTASTPAIDRHQTVVPQYNWKLGNFNANPVIGYNHYVWGDEGWMSGMGNPDNVIGKGRAYLNSLGNLQIDIKFDDVSNNTTAEKVKAKVENGFLNAVSVGFVEKTEGRWLTEDGKEARPIEADLYEYGEVELMEVSVVNLPANPEALVMSKEAQIEDLKSEIKSLKAVKKEIGEAFTKVGETMQIFSDPEPDAHVEAAVEYEEDEDFEKLEDEKVEQLYNIRKRKARNRARRINL